MKPKPKPMLSRKIYTDYKESNLREIDIISKETNSCFKSTSKLTNLQK